MAGALLSLFMLQIGIMVGLKRNVDHLQLGKFRVSTLEFIYAATWYYDWSKVNVDISGPLYQKFPFLNSKV